jgi:hypothetical protein
MKKSDKFFTIPSSHGILEYNFILTHLYLNIEVLFQVVKMTVKFILNVAGHLGMLGPLTQVYH